jgi:hypothetical protein
MTIYEQLKAAGVPLSNHESNLYAKVTPESQRIIGRVTTATVVHSRIDGELWYDIPFAYDPWWIKRGCTCYVNKHG